MMYIWVLHGAKMMKNMLNMFNKQTCKQHVLNMKNNR